MLPHSFTLPKAQTQTSLSYGCGSSDAWLLAQLLIRAMDERRLVLVVTANPADAPRLQEELRWFLPEAKTAFLSDWETLPYDLFSPHVDLVSERLATLWELQKLKGIETRTDRAELNLHAVFAAASTVLQRLAPPSFLAGHSFVFKVGQSLAEDQLRQQLVTAGYEHVSQVVKPGEYSIRGSLIDLYPMGSALPFRIDRFGDDIDGIKHFDPDTQRTLYPVQEIRLLPGHEFPSDEAACAKFRGRWREYFEGDPSKSIIYRDAGQGILSGGIEYYLPLFFDQTATLFDHLPAHCLVMTHGDLQASMNGFLADTAERYRFAGKDRERPLMKPEHLFLSTEQFFELANASGRLHLRLEEAVAPAVPPVAVERRAEDPLRSLRKLLEASANQDSDPSSATHTQRRYLILAESVGRQETLNQYFNEWGLRPQPVDSWQAALESLSGFMLATAPLQTGFQLPDLGLTLITEVELFGGAARRSKRGSKGQQTQVDAIIRDLSELKIGDPVVHVQHGVGRYQGLLSLDLGDGATEFLQLNYANDAKLYVPVAQLHVITRYSGAGGDDAPLHTLGSGQWDKAKRKAAEKARDTAAELLNLYARRALREGHSFKFNARDYEAFAASFPFEETPDQLAAIHATIQDMISDKPMDRLVCGDVGFGKTEVALRAAFIAVADGKQVAVLCPTTLLAEQHYQTFKDRFADWPVKIAELSRFRSQKEVAAAIDGLNKGEIDIVVGTHALLNPKMQFKRLGLLVIDEEHRFGVRHKEALKALRAEVDILTLTATPIPRTLAMSLEGLREFSVIATAPQKRLAIKTFVRRESDGTIREAMLRELKRGGQCYFLHNEVDTIENRKLALERLVPEARIAVAHGQMPERDLERVMRDFTSQRFNVLLCTTIIETGIDVPTANTILIHRADKFGLAQLHQLRGRVGRSHHQAYAYLMVPDESAVTKDAAKRLEAIQAMEELGSGFFLAMHDLEIRGAGEVLGESQSGEMIEVGFSLYNDMITQAIKALKAGKEPDILAPLAAVTEINLHTPALLPEDYCPDVNERLTLYKRLANTAQEDDLIRLQEELIDRFGKLPEPAIALIETHRLRLRCEPLGILKIDAAPNAMIVQFGPQTPVTPERIIQFIQAARDVRLAGQDKIRFTLNDASVEARIQRLKSMMNALQPETTPTPQ